MTFRLAVAPMPHQLAAEATIVPQVSLALAIQDFVPVIVSAIGWLYVVRVVQRTERTSGRLARFGASLVIAGGLSRATWKLIVALDGPDIGPLHTALYPLLVGGFLALASALWATRSGRAPGRFALAIPVVTVIALAALSAVTGAGAGGGRSIPVMWLAVATAGSAVVAILLARRAWRHGRMGLAALFIIALVMTLALAGIARVPVQDESIQWLEQGANSMNQLVFTLAAWGLWREESRPSSTRPKRGRPD